MAEQVRLKWFGVCQHVSDDEAKFGGQGQKSARMQFRVLRISTASVHLYPSRVGILQKRSTFRTHCYRFQIFLSTFRSATGGACVLRKTKNTRSQIIHLIRPNSFFCFHTDVHKPCHVFASDLTECIAGDYFAEFI